MVGNECRALISEPPETRAELIRAGRRAFAFLEAQDAKVELDDSPYRSVLAYCLASAAFEVECDWREQAVFVLVCRTVDGNRPPGYYMHQGHGVRVHLFEALAKTHLIDRPTSDRLHAVSRAWGPGAMKAQLAAFSEVLAERFEDLVTKYDLVFS